MSPPALSRGIVSSHLIKGLCPPDDKAVFRVLGVKSVPPDGLKYRIAVTDANRGETSGNGCEMYNKALIAVAPDAVGKQILPDKDDVVDFGCSGVQGEEDRNAMVEVGGKTIWVVRHYRILGGDDNDDDNESPQLLPATPSRASTSATASPPRPPSKRPAEVDLQTPSTSSATAAKASSTTDGAKRTLLFESPSKATHKIKDLNPYQNKYTILARASKGELKEISTSRWQGSVFNVTLQDDSGDIRASGFNEIAKRFHSSFVEGKIYYVSHAQVKPIKDAKFNFTSHSYELGLNQNTVVNECKDASAANGVPTTANYKFTAFPDLARKAEKELVDVLGVCCRVQDVREINTRNGRQVRKRDVTLEDQSGTEIQMTLWAEKAEDFAGLGRVVAFSRATVSEFGGSKTLSLSFGGSLEIDPDIPDARNMQQWYDTSRHQNGARNLAGPSSGSRDSEDFVSIGEIKRDFGASPQSQARYYNLDAYLNLIQNGDNPTYGACPVDQCNKKLTEQSPGSYYCNKCRTSTATVSQRYMLRGMVADATDYIYFTAFDEAAMSIIGVNATELMRLRDTDPGAFRKQLADAQFVRYKFRVSCKLEMYNDENRLKMTIINASRINQGADDHVQRIRRQLDNMQRQ